MHFGIKGIRTSHNKITEMHRLLKYKNKGLELMKSILSKSEKYQ